MPISKKKAKHVKELFDLGGYDLLEKQLGLKKKSTIRRYLRFANHYERIGEETDNANVDLKDVKHGWLKTSDSSLFFVNKEFEEQTFDEKKIDWNKIIEPLNLSCSDDVLLITDGLFDRFVYADVHVGMNPNPDGFSLYGGKWGEDELFDALKQTISHIKFNRMSSEIVVDDLGDLMDGWDAKTVRREHELPQNMDNQKAFDVALRFKWQMFMELAKMYEKITLNNMCIDNHSGSFGYVVNSAFKTMVDSLGNENYTVNNYRRFINHYSVGNHTFIISHGKDDKNLKFGFKPKLDKVGMEKIDNYIDAHFLLQPDVKIEFSKGDSHQLLFDWSTSDRFNYFNYPAFSPSSSWIQVNFKRGKSGFVFFNYLKNGECNILPKFFKWKE